MTNTTNSKRRRRMAREPQPTADAQPNARSETSAAKRIPPPIYEKGLSKTDKALALLRRQGGATPDELVEATGWLPHTTRAALTGLKKKGHTIERNKVDGVSLSGEARPKHADNEQGIDELSSRLRKTIAFAEAITEEQFACAGARKIALPWAPGKALAGEDYLLQAIVPNVYFHLTMAYAILRHNGVDLGKMDFLGSIRWAMP